MITPARPNSGAAVMNPVRPFLNSLYLSLAVALTAVGIAGGDLLPEIPFITGFCLLLLAAAYWGEGRWELSLRDANLVGLFLGALLGLWGIFQAVRPPTGLADLLPWPASALPYLAPVLMLLIPAKLFRPKRIGDFWSLYGIAFVSLTLACVLDSDFVFGPRSFAGVSRSEARPVPGFFSRRQPAGRPESRLRQTAGAGGNSARQQARRRETRTIANRALDGRIAARGAGRSASSPPDRRLDRVRASDRVRRGGGG